MQVNFDIITSQLKLSFMKREFFLVILAIGFLSRLSAQTPDTSSRFSPVRFGAVVPLTRYIQLAVGEKIIQPDKPTALHPEEIARLQVAFLRDNLSAEDGPQFLKVTTTATNKNEHLLESHSQYAITFHRLSDASADLQELERYGSRVAPLGYVNPDLLQGVPIQTDTLDDWGHLFIFIEPEQEIVKYYGRIKNRLEYHILVKAGTIETGFSLSVPKVLYDTRRDDSVAYGNTSVMIRFYLLNSETGMRYPVNIGIGTFGVESPIDVSRNGGGFAISLYFDIVQFIRTFDVRLPSSVNAGFDVSPFFSIGRKPRLLFNARLGISP